MLRAIHRCARHNITPSILLVTALLVSFSVAQEAPRHIVLPSTELMGCQTPACSQVLPEQTGDAQAIYPWQVMVDFNQGKVIGLTAYYDKPVTFEDLRAAIDARYAKWAASFSNDKLRAWRVEPEHFVISLSVVSSGMVRVIYLIFDAKHPASAQAEEYLWCSVEQAVKHCAPARQTASSH
jgi:hypothetical protein